MKLEKLKKRGVAEGREIDMKKIRKNFELQTDMAEALTTNKDVLFLIFVGNLSEYNNDQKQYVVMESSQKQVMKV